MRDILKVKKIPRSRPAQGGQAAEDDEDDEGEVEDATLPQAATFVRAYEDIVRFSDCDPRYWRTGSSGHTLILSPTGRQVLHLRIA